MDQCSRVQNRLSNGDISLWVRPTTLRPWRARQGRLEAAIWRRLVEERLGRWAVHTAVPGATASYSLYTKTPNDRTRCAIGEGFEVRIIGAAHCHHRLQDCFGVFGICQGRQGL